MQQKTKQLIMTLVALLALTTGARAEWTGGTYTATANETLSAINVSDDATLTINPDVTVTVNGSIVVADGKTLTITGGGTLVANGANGADGDNGATGATGGTGGNGNAGGTAIVGNVIINGVGLTVTAIGGQGGEGGQGGQGGPGDPGGKGGPGGTGGNGADGGSAFSGAVTIYAGSVTANGGKGGNGGKGAYAFAGTLTVYGGNVSANGGNLGIPGMPGYPGDSGGYAPPTSQGSPGQPGTAGTVCHAYANSVTFKAATYTITNDYGNTIDINNITSLQKVIIESADVEPAPAPTPVDLTRGTGEKINEWTLTNGMPAGNVTVKVNYYPQATADGAVTATTGAIATTDAPLVTIDPDMLTGADGMMYYVSETSTAPDYTATGWTTDVPNAKNYTEAKTLYLWYYPLGRVGQTADDIYSDGNMNDEPLELSVAPLPTYDIAVGAGKFATFYDLFNVMLDPETPEGVGLYTITSIDEQRTKATLAPLTGIVPGGTPMIIYNGTGSEQSVKLKATTDEANGIYPVFIDQFVGESTDVWFDENAMANYDFYLLSGGKAFAPVLGPGRLKANQCFLIFSKQSGARTIQLVFEDATGITTVSGSPADAPLYDLNGRRVTKPAKKGIYIQNGRKVVR